MTEQQKEVLQRHWDKPENEAMYQTEYKAICVYILRMVRNQALAEEFTQETFLRLIEQGNDADKIQNRRAWLYRTARNLIFDYFRREKKREEIHGYLSVFPSQKPTCEVTQLAEKEEAENMLLEKLNHLPVRQREAVRLKFQEKLTYDEIAGVMGETRSTVGRLLSDAIRKLRDMMKD